MKRFSKFLTVLLVVSMILPGIAQAAPVVTAESSAVQRLAGKGREETAVAASEMAYKDGAENVVLVGYNGEVDALAGTLLANAKKAPLLITNQASLTETTKKEIARLKAKNVYILGGENVVSEEVEIELKALKYNVKRIEGADREKTAIAVAKEVGGTINHVFLAKGYDIYADALSVGPVSAIKNMPVFLTNTNSMTPATIQAMKDLGVKEVTIVGGEKTVTKKVEDQLKGIKINRISGDDREKTALAVADKFFPSTETSILASGYIFADALVGGYIGAKMNAPILLTNTNLISAETEEFIADNSLKIYVLGGEKVVSDKVLKKIEAAVKAEKVSAIEVTGTGGATTITEDKGTLQMVATVTPEGASDKSVTWSVENGTGEATISETGLLTAVADGTVTVKATANDGSEVFGEIEITISNQVAPPTTYVVTVAGDAAETTDYTVTGAADLAAVEDGTTLTITAVTDITVNGEAVAAEETIEIVITEAATITINKQTEEADLTAYNEALAAVVEADYTPESWEAYQLVVAANVVTAANTQAEVDSATAAIIAAQAELVEVPAEADLTAYNAALAAVEEADYTAESWEAYQVVVAANVMTVANTQAEVDAATSAITAAQAELVEVPAEADLTAYNAALAAVNEADYTAESWEAYQLVVAANVVTVANTQAEVDAATAAITAAQAELVEVEPVEVSAINIDGKAVVGEKLTATPDPAEATGSYQWMKADSADGTYEAIDGATARTYIVQEGDKFIKVKFTATGSYTGTPESEVIVVEVAKVESVSAVNATTIEVTFEGVEEPVEIKLEKALVHGENEVTFTYEDQEFTATVNYVDEDVVALEEATKAVKTAEETRLAADITTARELVNKLKASEAKAALEDRLNKITPVLEAPADGLQQLEVEGVTADGALFLVAGLGKDGGKAQTPSTLAEVKAFIEDKYKVAFNSEHIVVTDGKIEVTGSILSQDDWNKVKADGNKKMPYRITLVRDNSVVGETGKDSGKQVAKVAMYEDGKAVVEKVELTALGAANLAVEKAEGSNLQADVTAAQALVTALPDGETKTALQARIDAVQDIIDARAAALDVKTLEGFKAALENEKVEEIKITASFDTTEKILVNRAVEIDGGNNTITFTGDPKGAWNSNFVLHVYDTEGVVIKDISLTGGDAALLVNGSEVTLTGAIDVSGNQFGGIESSKGSGLLTDPSLTVTEVTFTNTSEAYGLPTIWEDGVAETVTGFTGTKIVKGTQPQYYLDAGNSVDPNAHIANVKDLAELKTALADTTKTIINITASFDTAEKIVVSRPVSIDGGNKTITFTGDVAGEWNSNYVIQVYNTTGVTIGDLKLTGADAALLVNGSEVTLTGAIDVSGNEFGGIESSKGSGVTAAPSLTVTGVDFTNTSEEYGLPTIWEDGVAETVTGFKGTKITKGTQPQYYLTVGNSVDPAIAEANLAITDALANVNNVELAFGTDVNQENIVAKLPVVEGIEYTAVIKEGSTWTVTVKDTAGKGTPQTKEIEVTVGEDPSKAVVTDKAGLEAALLDEAVTEITIDGTLGSDNRTDGYTIYNVNRTVTIKGADGAKVFGTFIIKADNVTIKDLAIQNQGDLGGNQQPSPQVRGNIVVYAKNVTLKNNTITHGLGEVDGLANAVQIFSNVKDNPLSSYVIESNSIEGFNNEARGSSSAAILIAQGYNSTIIGKEFAESITATPADYAKLLNNNTFINNKIDLTHQDWEGGLEVLYPVAETDPVIESATVVKDDNGNLVLTVTAKDDNLYSLEVDHSHGKHGKWASANLPEFHVYADAEKVYGTSEAGFETAGLTAAYDESTQTWTLTFKHDGKAMGVINDEGISNGAIDFFLAVYDVAGNNSKVDGKFHRVSQPENNWENK